MQKCAHLNHFPGNVHLRSVNVSEILTFAPFTIHTPNEASPCTIQKQKECSE